MFLTGTLSVQIRRSLGIHETQIGIVVAVFFAAAAVTSVYMGHLADRLGAVRIIHVAGIFTTFGLLLIAAYAHSTWQLACFLALAGFGNGATQPAVNGLLARQVVPNHQGFAFGLKQASIPLATLLGGLAVPVVALTVGWQWAFAGAGILALISGRLVPEDPKPSLHRDVSRTFTKPSSSPLSTSQGRYMAAPEPIRSARPRTIDPLALLVLALGAALGAGAANALGAFIVPAAVARGFHPGTAGLVAALGSLCGLTVRVLIGLQADHRNGRHLPVVATMLALGAGGYAALALGDPVIFVLGTAVAYGAGWGWNGLFNYAIVRTHPDAPSRATGITQAGIYVGGIFGPLAFGFIVDHSSYKSAWWMDTAVAVVAAIAVLIGRHLLVTRRATASSSDMAGASSKKL